MHNVCSLRKQPIFFFWLHDCDKSYMYLQNWETIFSMSKRFLSQLMCRLRWQPEFSPVPSRRRKNKTQAKGNDWFLGQLYSELAETHLKVARKLWKLSQHGNQIFLPLNLSKQKKTVYTKNRHSSSSTSRHSGDSAMLHSADILDTFWIVMCW